MKARGFFYVGAVTNRTALVENFFEKLQDEEYFKQFVTSYFDAVPAQVADILECTIEIDPELVAFAYGEYVQNIDRFAARLHSSNPDHYKRAGALLYSLYQSRIITGVAYNGDLDDIECGMGPVQIHAGDVSAEDLSFARFYSEFHNEMVSFIFAFQCCAAYEEEERSFDFDFLHNMCAYMSNNTNLSLETFFIIFKALMHG